MELVTGFAGQAHVDPIDMAHVNAVAFGHDAYLLDTQNKLEPTLETANKLVVDTGDLMIQGHHFTVVQSEEIALRSGISGQKRNALVCARYDKASGTGIETASWVVKYGTATTGTPTDPDVTTGNILDGVDSVHEEPIFRIEYDGITPGDPILLVPEFQSNAKFRTSIAPTFYQTEKQTAMMPGTSNHMFNFALDLQDGYTACALQYLSITSSNAACVAGSYRIVDNQLNVNVRNTSGAQISAYVEASILCLRLP